MKTSTSTYWTNLGVLPSCSLQDANFLLEMRYLSIGELAFTI
jgi:hypothetical protein